MNIKHISILDPFFMIAISCEKLIHTQENERAMIQIMILNHVNQNTLNIYDAALTKSNKHITEYNADEFECNRVCWWCCVTVSGGSPAPSEAGSSVQGYPSTHQHSSQKVSQWLKRSKPESSAASGYGTMSSGVSEPEISDTETLEEDSEIDS